MDDVGEAHRLAADHLAVVIVAYGDAERVRRTLQGLRREPATSRARTIVVVNDAQGASRGVCAACGAADEVVELPENSGVEAFNVGAQRAARDVLLILDDDAIPDEGAVDSALRHLLTDEKVGAVALEPVVPAEFAPAGRPRSEWGRVGPEVLTQRRWPLLGCANLVRAAAWAGVGGYESRFFLYANDTDLALKLLSAGWDVVRDPRWRARHETRTAFDRPDAWFRLATRNRVWTARRHAPCLWPVYAALACVDTHFRAGRRARAHARAVRGAIEGVLDAAPRLPSGVRPCARGMRSLVAMRWKALLGGGM